jgi:hypothetical protein
MGSERERGGNASAMTSGSNGRPVWLIGNGRPVRSRHPAPLETQPVGAADGGAETARIADGGC